MKKMSMLTVILFGTLCFFSQTLFSQSADFENLSLPVDSFWNGSDLSGEFMSGGFKFMNNYDTTYSSWSGFAYSSMQDTTTADFMNQYSAITGEGADSSDTYAVANLFGSAEVYFSKTTLTGFYVTNSTYAYLSMKNGDDFAKKFGGESGDDADFFKLSIVGKDTTSDYSDTLDFYLADYRFSDNSQDYIVKDWEWVDLSSFNEINKLEFKLSSSDVGDFGMNTPSYFCMDNLNDTAVTNATRIKSVTTNIAMNVYPNPCNNQLNISIDKAVNGYVSIFDLSGKAVFRNKLNEPKTSIDISNLKSGIYLISVNTDSGKRVVQKIIKQ